jgi:hypothetical protein
MARPTPSMTRPTPSTAPEHAPFDGHGTEGPGPGGDRPESDQPLDQRAAERIQRNGGDRVLCWIARIGLAARGTNYALVGILALRIALGDGSEAADSDGAFRTVIQESFGEVLLLVLCAGFLAHAVWRLARAFLGRSQQDGGLRRWATTVADAGTGMLYLGLLASAVSILLGDRSRDDDEAAWTARFMDLPAGQVLVVLGGLIAIGTGIYWAARVVHQRFEPPLDEAQMGPTAERVVPTLGSVGYVARALTAAMVGVFLIQAAVRHDPDEAEGLDGALQAVADGPVGGVLLIVVSGCLIAYGAFSWCQARWADVNPTTDEA